jgi:hypothetical protein
MSALATLDDVKTYLGNQTNTADDMVLSSLITGESAFILSWIGRKFDSESYTDLFGGNGGQEHLFKNYPVQTIISVTIDGAAIPPAATIQDRGYMLFDDRLLLFGYQFSWGKRNCQAIYTAGQDVPDDVKQACIELVAYRYKGRGDRIGLSSKSIAGETTSYVTKDMPDHVKTTLQRHRRVFPG